MDDVDCPSSSLQKLSTKVVSTLGSTSDDYFAIAPPETPISLWYSLRVSLRVYIVVSFSEG